MSTVGKRVVDDLCIHFSAIQHLADAAHTQKFGHPRVTRLPAETTILRIRHLLEKHDLAADMLRVVNDILEAKGLMIKKGTVVDTTLITAPSSTKNFNFSAGKPSNQAA